MAVTIRKQPVIAIDGPAGSGKSTLAKLLAKSLKYNHIDTGALYRGVACLALRKKIGLADEEAVVEAARDAHFEFRTVKKEQHLFINGEDFSSKLRAENISKAASVVSAHPGVRALLLGLQRKLGREGGAVLEGRDIGTVVFPDAEIKFFLTASLEARAKRRAKDLEKKGEKLSLTTVKTKLKARDENDMKRTVAPLKKADDAIEIDTTKLTIEKVLEKMLSYIEQKYN